MIIKGKSIGGKLVFGDYNSKKLRQDLQENPNATYELKRLSVESKNQRGFLHGGVYPLWAYLNDWDYKDESTIDFLHEQGKKEFNGEMILRDGKKVIRGKSTKGILNEYTEKVVEYLEEHYAIDREKVLNNEHYKTWRDTIRPYGGAEYYIDYLLELNLLP